MMDFPEAIRLEWHRSIRHVDVHTAVERATALSVRRYAAAVDVKRAADLYAQGWTLRQIGAELGVHWSTVSQQPRRAGVTMRRGGPPAHPASTQQILELRDQGLTWTEVAEQVGMTVSGAWSRYRRARPSQPARLGRWQQILAGSCFVELPVHRACDLTVANLG